MRGEVILPRTELEEITLKIIQKEKLASEEAWQRNKTDGWQIAGNGSYRLSDEIMNEILEVANGNVVRHSLPGQDDNLPLDERLNRVAYSLILNNSAYKPDPITYTEAKTINESDEGWRLLQYNPNPDNIPDKEHSVIRFTPQVFENAWQNAQEERIYNELIMVTANILVKKYGQNLPQYSYDDDAHVWANFFKEKGDQINREEGWITKSGSFRLTEETLGTAAMQAEYYANPYLDDGYGTGPTQKEGLTNVGVALIDGKYFTLEDAKLQNKCGWQVSNVGSIQLDEKVLERAWYTIRFREQVSERLPENQSIKVIKERSLEYSDARER